MPRVQKMSLCATGMPSSGPVASPCARRSSARLASASARASSTVMKAFSAPSPLSKRPIRPRYSWVSSTEEIFFACRAAESCESVAFNTYSMTFGTR